jgi:hypothetical protein
MKCEEFLPAMERGSFMSRIVARRHAARCERCAAVRVRWLEARRQWANPTAATAAQRALWAQVATTERQAARAIAWPARRWAVAAVAGLLVLLGVGVGVWRGLHGEADVARVPDPVIADTGPAPMQISDPVIFEALERGLDQLAMELDELAQEAALMDARQSADQLLTTYQPLGASETSN